MSQPIGSSGQPDWGNDPTARAKAEKAYRKAQRPIWKKKRAIIPAGLVAIIGVSSIASAGDKKDDTSTTASGATGSSAPAKATAPPLSDAAQNVQVTDCKVDDLAGTKFATIGYTVVNPTSKTSNYLIAIDIIDSTGARVSEANGAENNVLPNRPSQGQALGNVSSSAVGPFTCNVGKITRLATG